MEVAMRSEIGPRKQLFSKTKHSLVEADALKTNFRGLSRCKNDTSLKVTVLNLPTTEKLPPRTSAST